MEHYSNFGTFEIASLPNVPRQYLRKYGNNEKMKNYSTILFLEHPSACSAEETDESISYFQIQDANGNALDATREGPSSSSDVMFTQNEFKDSQFWYLSKIPGTEYGFIGSKKYISEKKVLTITKGKL